MTNDKVIVSAAITGSVHTPSMSPYLPITPEEIANDAIKAAEAGASIVHIHARDENGRPSPEIDLYRVILEKISEESDVVVCITTGGGAGMSVEERAKVIPEFEPEMASLDMGSMNFGLYPAIEKIKEFKYEWEKQYMEMSRDYVHKNTFADCAHIAETMREHDTKPELECFSVSQIYNTKQLVREGVLEPPHWLQFCLGMLGGIGNHYEDLMYMKRVADRLFGKDNFTWQCLGPGRHQFRIITQGISMGGNIRVGMEDNLWLEKGQLAKSNAEQVEKAVSIVEATGKKPATPDETRDILGLKGKEKTNF